MIQPAILWKDEISKAFNRKLYTQEHFWYDGGIDNYEQEIKEEANKYQFAIVVSGQLIGFISFRVDWYCSCAYNFGLIKFLPYYFDSSTYDYKESTPKMVSAIREVIRMIEGFNLHRIDFRCVGGNPAEKGYDRILKRFQGKYDLRKVYFKDNIKDRQGKYHDTKMYELIRR